MSIFAFDTALECAGLDCIINHVSGPVLYCILWTLAVLCHLNALVFASVRCGIPLSIGFPSSFSPPLALSIRSFNNLCLRQLSILLIGHALAFSAFCSPSALISSSSVELLIGQRVATFRTWFFKHGSILCLRPRAEVRLNSVQDFRVQRPAIALRGLGNLCVQLIWDSYRYFLHGVIIEAICRCVKCGGHIIKAIQRALDGAGAHSPPLARAGRRRGVPPRPSFLWGVADSRR